MSVILGLLFFNANHLIISPSKCTVCTRNFDYNLLYHVLLALPQIKCPKQLRLSKVETTPLSPVKAVLLEATLSIEHVVAAVHKYVEFCTEHECLP